MKCCLLAFFFFGIASGFSFVHPSGNQESFLAVLQNLFLGRQLKDFPNCGRPREITENKVDRSTDGLAAKRQVIDNEKVKECLGLEGDDSKTIIKSHDNVGSKDYENNKTKTGYIYSKRSFIKAKFYFLNIEPSFRCSYDYLQFRDRNAKNETLETFCGERTTSIADRFYNTRALQFRFATDQITTSDGFCVELDCGSEPCIKLSEEEVEVRVLAVIKVKQYVAEAKEAAERAELASMGAVIALENTELSFKIAEEAEYIAKAEARSANISSAMATATAEEAERVKEEADAAADLAMKAAYEYAKEANSTVAEAVVAAVADISATADALGKGKLAFVYILDHSYFRVFKHCTMAL